jgi:hypothetical protein
MARSLFPPKHHDLQWATTKRSAAPREKHREIIKYSQRVFPFFPTVFAPSFQSTPSDQQINHNNYGQRNALGADRQKQSVEHTLADHS